MVAESESVDSKARRPRLPWTFLFFRYSPWGTLPTGIVFGLVTLAALVTLEILSGRPQQILQGYELADIGCTYLMGDYRIAIVGVILLAYTTTARFVLTQWTHETAALLSSSNFTDAESLAEQRYWGVLPGLLGVILTLTFGFDISEEPITMTARYWILPHLFNWAWCIPFGWAAGRLFYSVPANAIFISKIAKSIEVPDLAHTEPLEATIKHGSRSALISTVFLGLVSVHFVDPGVGLVAAGVLFVLFLAGVAIASVPVVGAVARLHDTRDAQVARIRQEREEEETKLIKNDGTYMPGRMADLVALENHLQEQRITIFRVSNLARLLIYAGIGLLSWLGAAAVSVFVERLLGV